MVNEEISSRNGYMVQNCFSFFDRNSVMFNVKGENDTGSSI